MNMRAVAPITYLALLLFSFSSVTAQKPDSTKMFFVENFTFEKGNELSKKIAIEELRKRNWSEEYIDQIVKSHDEHLDKRKKKWQYPNSTLEGLKKLGIQCQLIEIGDSSYKKLESPKIFKIRYFWEMRFFKGGGFAIILKEVIYDKRGAAVFSSDEKNFKKKLKDL